jgi:hypothetical protein
MTLRASKPINLPPQANHSTTEATVNIETLSGWTVLKWISIATAFLTALILLMVDTMGFALAPFVVAHLWWFRPPRTTVTDAELRALLDGAV